MLYDTPASARNAPQKCGTQRALAIIVQQASRCFGSQSRNGRRSSYSVRSKIQGRACGSIPVNSTHGHVYVYSSQPATCRLSTHILDVPNPLSLGSQTYACRFSLSRSISCGQKHRHTIREKAVESKENASLVRTHPELVSWLGMRDQNLHCRCLVLSIMLLEGRHHLWK
jgi:hypothetical protein